MENYKLSSATIGILTAGCLSLWSALDDYKPFRLLNNRTVDNIAGYLLGFRPGPVTGDSLFGGYAKVYYLPEVSIQVSKYAAQLPSDELAEKVCDVISRSRNVNPKSSTYFPVIRRDSTDNLVQRMINGYRANPEHCQEAVLYYNKEYHKLNPEMYQPIDKLVIRYPTTLK